ncbi:MAG: DUF262 domain-containing protein [Eubacteriales bacterium]|nr:DUF262 domain-containing protein [Eubacteriales bacterium]
MDAHKLWMLRDFIGTNKVLFRIPVYQRNYDWSESNCNRLLDDIYGIMQSGDKHFLGTIVFMAAKSGGFALQEYIIIDGQQRLTTLMLILKALSVVAESVGDDCYHEIEEQYLHNKYCDEEFKVKLKPIKSDNNQFLLLLEDKIDEMDEDTHIYHNFMLCKERFERWAEKGINPSQVLDALTKLEIVEIVLTKGEDDPQVIFESINSTGLELSNADLIRNYLLMNADDQEKLYENYWLYIEKTLRNKMDYSNLDAFFMQYIVYKTSKPVNSRQLYNSFVKLFKDSGYSQESILKELRYYAEIFGAFVYGSAKYSERINRLLYRLRVLNQTTCYPFLLHVFDDYHQGVIDEETVEKILQFILAYLLRRMVCGVPSNTLRGLFTYLYNRIFKVASNKQKYYETLNKFLFTVSSKDVIPSAGEFERALQKANIYGNNALCRFLLLDIENGDGKEILQAENLTIEHIMPQTLSADWSHIRPEEHEEYLHTLGNLSVTGYNSELSNKSFAEKQDIIRENSKAVILNSDVLDKESWNITTIQARAKRLAGIVMTRYKIDRIVDDSIEFEYIETLTLDNYDEVTGKKLVSFKLFGETYRQNKYALMLLDVIKLLDKKSPGKLQTLAENNYSFNSTKRKHVHLNIDGSGMRWPWKVADGIYLEANLSAWSCIRFIENLLSEFGFEKDQFSFNIVAEEPSETNEDEE